MSGQVRRALAVSVAVLLVWSGDPAGLLFAAAIVGAVVSDALWRPVVEHERQARAVAEADAEMYDQQAERYWQRMREAEELMRDAQAQALAVDLRERQS